MREFLPAVTSGPWDDGMNMDEPPVAPGYRKVTDFWKGNSVAVLRVRELMGGWDDKVRSPGSPQSDVVFVGL